MTTTWALALLLALQDGPEEKEVARFITFAVFEGLYEDGAEADVVKNVAQDPWKLFIPKCPLCLPMRHAFSMMANAPAPLLFDGRGKGLPKDTLDALRSADLATRKKGLEALVKRYVDRRFERLRMPDVEKARLRGLMDIGRKKAIVQCPDARRYLPQPRRGRQAPEVRISTSPGQAKPVRSTGRRSPGKRKRPAEPAFLVGFEIRLPASSFTSQYSTARSTCG